MDFPGRDTDEQSVTRTTSVADLNTTKGEHGQDTPRCLPEPSTLSMASVGDSSKIDADQAPRHDGPDGAMKPEPPIKSQIDVCSVTSPSGESSRGEQPQQQQRAKRKSTTPVANLNKVYNHRARRGLVGDELECAKTSSIMKRFISKPNEASVDNGTRKHESQDRRADSEDVEDEDSDSEDEQDKEVAAEFSPATMPRGDDSIQESVGEHVVVVKKPKLDSRSTLSWRDWVFSAFPGAEDFRHTLTKEMLAGVVESFVSGVDFQQGNLTITVAPESNMMLFAKLTPAMPEEARQQRVADLCQNLMGHMHEFQHCLETSLLAKCRRLWRRTPPWLLLAQERLHAEVHVHFWRICDPPTDEDAATPPELALWRYTGPLGKQHKAAGLFGEHHLHHTEKLRGQMQICAESTLAAEVTYLSFLISGDEGHCIARQYPLVMRAVRDVLTGVPAGSPLADYSDVDVGMAMLARTQWQLSTEGSFKVDCLAAPGPKTFDTNLMRGALSSFFQFLLKRYKRHKLVAFLCCPLSDPRAGQAEDASPEDVMDLLAPSTGSKASFADSFLLAQDLAAAQQDALLEPVLKAFQETYSKTFHSVVQEWKSKMTTKEGFIVKGGLIDHKSLPPSAHWVSRSQAHDKLPVSMSECFRWMIHWMYTQRFHEMKWVVVGSLVCMAWTFVEPLLLADMIQEATVSAATDSDGEVPGAAVFVFGFRPILNAATLVGLLTGGKILVSISNRDKNQASPSGADFHVKQRFALAQHLTRTPHQFRTVADHARIMSVLQNDIPILSDTVDATVLIFDTCLNLVATFATLFFLSWKLSLVLLAIYPLFVLTIRRDTRNIARMDYSYRTREKTYMSRLEEVMSSISTIRVAGCSQAARDGLWSMAAETARLGGVVEDTMGNSVLHIEFINTVMQLTLFGFGVFLISDGELLVGEFMAYYLSSLGLHGLATDFTSALASYSRAQASLTSMLSITNIKPERYQFQTCMSKDVGGILMHNVDFYYDLAQRTVLSQPTLSSLNFFVPSGMKLGVTGVSGSGKSTLFQLLTRLLQPSAGMVVIDGVPLNEVDVDRMMTLVQQDVVLFDDTLMNNLLMGIKDEPTLARIEEVIDRVQLRPVVNKLPHGLDNFLGAKGGRLSGGERQRVSIARGVLANRPFMFMDEPTSAQDAAVQTNIVQFLSELTIQDKEGSRRSVTLLAIAHSLSFFDYFDNMMVVGNGTVMEFGPKKELMERKGAYYQMMSQQAGLDASSGRVVISPDKLQQIWIFAASKPEALQGMSTMFTTRHLKAGEELYAPGDDLDTLYIVAGGLVEETWKPPKEKGRKKKKERKKEKRVKRTARFMMGDSLCPETLVESRQAISTAKATEKTALLALNQVYFEDFIVKHPKLDEEIKAMVKQREEIMSFRFFRKVWPFFNLTDDQLTMLMERATTSVVEAGTKLFDNPAKCKALYAVVHGSVVVSVLTPGAMAASTVIYGPNQFIGELNCVGRLDPTMRKAEVSKRSVIVTLGYSEVGQVMSARPDIQVAINRMCDAQAENMDKLVAEHWLLQAVCSCGDDVAANKRKATRLRRAFRTRTVSDGQMLWRPSMPCSMLLSVVAGQVQETLCTPENTQWQVLKSSGESMGEMSLLAKNPKDVTHVESVFAEVTKLAVVSTLDVAAFRTIIGEERIQAMVEMVALRQSWRSSSALGGYKLKIQADLQQEVHMVQTTVFVPSGETLMPKTLGWFGVVLYGTLAWKAPHDGNAKPGDVVMDAAGAEQALAVQVEQAQTVGNRGAVVMVAELAELSEAAVQERASRLDQLKGEETERKRLKRVNAELRWQLRDIMFPLVINNAVVRSTKPEVLALMKPPDDSLPSASRLRRWWRRAYVRVRVVAVFLHVSDNEVGTLEDTREVLLARIATLKQEEQRRLVNIAQRMEVLKHAWLKLDQALSPEQLEMTAAEEDVSVARMEHMEQCIKAAQRTETERLGQQKELCKMAAELAQQLELDEAGPLYLQSESFLGKGVRTDQMEALKQRVHAIELEKRLREKEIRRCLNDLEQVCDRLHVSFEGVRDGSLAEWKGLVTNQAVREHQREMEMMMEGLREPQQKALDDCAVYYTEFEVPQAEQMRMPAPGSPITLAGFDAVLSELKHLEKTAKVVFHFTGYKVRPKSLPPPKEDMFEKRHLSYTWQLVDLLKELQTPDSEITAKIKSMESIVSKNLFALEDEIRKAQERRDKQLDGDKHRLDILRRIRVLANRCDDVAWLQSHWSQADRRFQNKGAMILYEEKVTKRLKEACKSVDKVELGIVTNLDDWEAQGKEPIVMEGSDDGQLAREHLHQVAETVRTCAYFFDAPGERERLLQRERRRRGTLDREGVAPASAMGTSPGYHMEDPLKRIAHQRESYDEAVKKVNPLFDETYNSISGAKEVRRRSASTFLSPAVAAKINTYYVKGFSSTKAVVPEGEATRGGSTGRDTPESSKKTLEDPRASRSSLSGVVSAGDDQGQGGAGSASDEERGGMRRRSAAAFVSRGASAQRWGAETGEDGAARRRRMILPEEVEMYDDESLIHPSGLTRAQSKPRSLHGERK